jgi:thioredoxin reductase (NADPH)
MESTDIAIIGAGPIGLEMGAAFQRAGVDYLHFDARQIGYTISWFAPQTRFFSSNDRIAIAGVPLHTPDGSKSTREQYLNYLRTVVELFDLKIRTYEPVKNIERDAQGFRLTTSRGQIHCNKLILATGGTDQPRRLNIPGEDLPHVSHYFRDPHTYFRTNVLIVGGKNSAVEAALRCHHAGAKVSMSYRRGQLPASSIKYWLMPEITGLIESGRIPAYFNTLPARIEDRSVTFNDGREIPADFVLLLIGYEADMSLCKLAGIELDGTRLAPRHNPRTMETSVPGIYIAGTAVGRTQDKYALFIENCHAHVDRILASLTGEKVAEHPTEFARPES